MSLHASQIANYFLLRAQDEGVAMTQFKLLKMMYIAHGWCLAVLDRDILGGEIVEAWRHGPVVTSIYHEFKGFGSNPINRLATDIEITSCDDDLDAFSYTNVTPQIDGNDSKLKEVLDFVWSIYRQYSGGDLVNMTHQPETPWSQSYQPGMRHVPISNEIIKSFYKKQVGDILDESIAS